MLLECHRTNSRCRRALQNNLVVGLGPSYGIVDGHGLKNGLTG